LQDGERLIIHALTSITLIEYEQALPLYQRILQILEKGTGSSHPLIVYALQGLATIYNEQKKYEQAESLYQQVLIIRENALGPHHPKTNTTRTAYTHLLRELGREEEALALENQVLESVIKS